MPRQLSPQQIIEKLTGLKVAISQTLEAADEPWLWTLEVFGPQGNGALLPWAYHFAKQWEKFAKNKRFFMEAQLIDCLGKFLQENYLDQSG